MKGWTVKTKVTKKGGKGIAARQYYLHNKDDPSHAKTEAIEQTWGSRKTMANIVYNAESAAAQIKAKGKGGRPTESYAIEFTLNLPKGRRPTAEQWKKITESLIRDIAKKLSINPQVIADQTYAVLHQQNQEIEYDARGRKVGTGDHIHVVIGKFTPMGTCLRDLQRKTITHVVKESFNNSTMKMGFDWTQYRDHELQVQEHANKRNIPTWRVKAARENDALDRRMAALSEKVARMEDRADEIEKRERSLEEREAEINEKMAELSEKMAEQKVIDKLLKNFENQGNKWLVAYEKDDKTQMNRQKNRLSKTLTALDAFGLLSEDAATVEAAMAMGRIELMMDKVNHCKPETLVKPTISRPKL